MKSSLAILLSCVALGRCMFVVAAPPAMKVEAFDRDPGWEGQRNRVVPK